MKQSSAVIIGASGSIGSAFIRQLIDQEDIKLIYAFARTEVSFDSAKVSSGLIDIEDENSIQHAADSVAKDSQPDLIVVTTGILHNTESDQYSMKIRRTSIMLSAVSIIG